MAVSFLGDLVFSVNGGILVEVLGNFWWNGILVGKGYNIMDSDSNR